MRLERDLIFFDIESTGLNPNVDRIIQLAAIKFTAQGAEVEMNCRLNPTIPISESASAVHGIKDEDVAGLRTFADVADFLMRFFEGCDLAGFNSNQFDIPLLANEFARCGLWLDLSGRKCIDASAIFRAHERRTLAAAYEFYCGKTLENAHDAMADITATVEVLQGQIERYGLEPDVAALAEYGKQPAIDPSGKIALNEYGYEVLTFGKHAGKALTEVAEQDLGYLQWILNGEFAETTKMLIRRVVS